MEFVFLMCYIDHLSGYVSYCETGYWRIFFQYAGNRNMKGAWKQRIVSSTLILSSIEFTTESGHLSDRQLDPLAVSKR
jgi:hypothetical protein